MGRVQCFGCRVWGFRDEVIKTGHEPLACPVPVMGSMGEQGWILFWGVQHVVQVGPRIGSWDSRGAARVEHSLFWPRGQGSQSIGPGLARGQWVVPEWGFCEHCWAPGLCFLGDPPDDTPSTCSHLDFAIL